MLKNSLLLLLLFTLSNAATAQQVTISGYITSKKSGEQLIGAVFWIPQMKAGVASNTFGFYSLTIPAPADSVEVSASYLGYQTFTQRLTATKNTVLNIALDESKELKEVVVTGSRASIQDKTQMSDIDIPIRTIKSLPAFLGEPDIMKAIQLLPGIQGGNEGTSGLYVRGGSPDQNLILLDGVPVYNASHLFGFFSVFNADAISNVNVIKGGFPARYGGRLSSVIDINMKEGDKYKIHGEGGIGIVASRLTLEGPLKKGKSSFMASGRRTYVDALAAPFMNGSSKGGYYFYDLNGKANFTLGQKDHLYLSGYFGKDKFYFSNKVSDLAGYSSFKSDIQWGNATGVARWNHEFGSRLFGNLTTYYSQYKFAVSEEINSTSNGSTDNFFSRYASGIYDVAARYDFDYFLNSRNSIKAGVGVIGHTYTPGVQTSRQNSGGKRSDTTLAQKIIYSTETDAYIEDDIKLTSLLKANIGLHASGFYVRDKLYTSVQPRISARYLINEQLSAKASYVQMNQYINLLTNSSIGLPTDLWVPSTDKIPPQLSHQGAMGLAYDRGKGYEISLEGYYKTMSNVLEYKEGASFFSSTTDWQDKVLTGKGKSYGAELFVQKKKGRFTGLFGYTLSWSTRTFADVNNGQSFPFKFDRRHDLKMAGVYKLSDRVELSAEWIYGTGNAITLPLGYYQSTNGGQVTIYGERNGYRMPAYHRADVSIRFSKENKRFTRSWILGAYNVYNHQNPFYIYEDNGTYKQISLFPIIPSISYQFKF